MNSAMISCGADAVKGEAEGLTRKKIRGIKHAPGVGCHRVRNTVIISPRYPGALLDG